ncbi:hypothetical protein HAX54_010920 [Datura stramonium]|uniref:Uncharacterized protein n=1 Tax=Datura stramonium TaxID=4076 RepID=A0ABS8RYQ8_DATST|nr:hypothetical protein [Datura stramonium]
MEDQCSPLSWPNYNYFLEEGIEELKHSLVYTTLELENTVISAHEELARKDEEILQLKDLLTRVLKERDEAQGKCQRLAMEKILLQQQFLQQQQQQVQFQFQFQKQNKNHLVIESAPISSGTTISHDNQEHDQILKGVVDSNTTKIGILSNSSDCDENNVVSPPLLVQDLMEKVVVTAPLPEKGKFLQAVMEAGPLLQTLLLAGPLPQWQHPPPQLNSIDIPLVTITSPTPRLLHQDSALSGSTGASPGGARACFGQKRDVAAAGFNTVEGIDTTSPQSISKYQKVVHQSSLTNM